MAEYTRSISRLNGRYGAEARARPSAEEADGWEDLLSGVANSFAKQYVREHFPVPPTVPGRRTQPSRGQGLADMAQLIRRALERNS